MIYPTSEYCAPAWCCSTPIHLIDSILNDGLWIVTECLHSTPIDNLPVLSGFQPAELCCQGATLSLVNCSSLDHGHIPDGQLTKLQAASKQRLKSTHPFLPAVQNYCTTYLSWASALPNGQMMWDTEYSLKVHQCSRSTFLRSKQGPLE